MQLNIAHLESQSDIYGPGTRFVIWVQGCSLRCPGCWNKEMWPRTPRQLYTMERLWTEIKQVRSEIEGITILGGEPLEQIEATRALIALAQEDGLSVVLFTGYEYAEIEAKGWQDVFQNTDILITGRYLEHLRTLDHQWIGSTNQEIHFLSERYDESVLRDATYMELVINEDGVVNVMGFPDDEWRTLVTEHL